VAATGRRKAEGRRALTRTQSALYPSPEREDPDAHLRRMAKATMRSKVLAARNDPNEFIEYCFKDSRTGAPLTQEPFHRELQEELAEGEDTIGLLPRDHGKTTQLEAFALWSLGNDPNLRLKIVCASDSKAVERLFTITQHLRVNPRVKQVFPWLRPAAMGDWTKHKIVVERDHISRDASIEALGVLSTATGGRADKLLADDVVDRRNALELPKLRETVKASWDSDWSNLLEPEGQTAYFATPWHTADLTHKVLKQKDIYRIIRHAVGSGGDQFEPLWPGKWPREALLRRYKKIGQLEYDRGFRLIALSGDIVVVRPDWIQYWDAPPDLGRLQVFQAYDLSSGKAADYFAAVTLGVDPETMTVFVLDAWHAKLTFLQQAGAVQRQARSWMPMVQGIERDPLGALGQYLGDTSLLNIIGMRPHLSKALRLSAVTPHLEQGRVVFNPALAPGLIVDPDGRGDLITELTTFPLAAHDDLVDAFVHAMNLAAAYAGADEPDAVGVTATVLGGDDDVGEDGLPPSTLAQLFDT
jgi:predicted phage terminase large subunit-like protein